MLNAPRLFIPNRMSNLGKSFPIEKSLPFDTLPCKATSDYPCKRSLLANRPNRPSIIFGQIWEQFKNTRITLP